MSGPAPSIAVVGAGKMGSALLAGLWRGEKLGRVLVIEPNPAPDVVELCRAKNFALFARVESSDAPVDALVLAIKPQMLDAASAFIERTTASRSAAPEIFRVRLSMVPLMAQAS